MVAADFPHAVSLGSFAQWLTLKCLEAHFFKLPIPVPASNPQAICVHLALTELKPSDETSPAVATVISHRNGV